MKYLVFLSKDARGRVREEEGGNSFLGIFFLFYWKSTKRQTMRQEFNLINQGCKLPRHMMDFPAVRQLCPISGILNNIPRRRFLWVLIYICCVKRVRRWWWAGWYLRWGPSRDAGEAFEDTSRSFASPGKRVCTESEEKPVMKWYDDGRHRSPRWRHSWIPFTNVFTLHQGLVSNPFTMWFCRIETIRALSLMWA